MSGPPDNADASAETPDVFGAYPRLSEAHLQALTRAGERRTTRPGMRLYSTGDVNHDFFVVLAGTVAMLDEDEGAAGQPLAVHGPGRFLGELHVLTGQPVFLTAEVREPGAVLAVPVERVRELVGQDSTLGDVILRAYLARRLILVEQGVGFRIVGSRFSPDTHRLRDFAARNRLPHRWIDLEADADAETLLRELGVGPSDTPVVIWRGRHVLRNPSNEELAALIGLRTHLDGGGCDLVVIGAGPAGLAAAVYGASEGLSTVVLDAVATGGQAGTSTRIENYLGFPAGISGAELAERAVIQATKFGARLTVPAEAVGMEAVGGRYRIRMSDGGTVLAASVVVATGARYRRPSIPRLREFEATSVHYAATEFEARLCRMDPVAVIGGGNSAGQASIFLAEHAASVRLLVRGPDLHDNMSRYLADRIERADRIEVMTRTEVTELIGGPVLNAVVVIDRRTGRRRELPARALFVFVGAQPCTDWLAGQVQLDEHGFVRTGSDAVGQSSALGVPLETTLPGVFAAGDVRSGSVKRVASAVGEGAMAVRLVHDHLAGRGVRVSPATRAHDNPVEGAR